MGTLLETEHNVIGCGIIVVQAQVLCQTGLVRHVPQATTKTRQVLLIVLKQVQVIMFRERTGQPKLHVPLEPTNSTKDERHASTQQKAIMLMVQPNPSKLYVPLEHTTIKLAEQNATLVPLEHTTIKLAKHLSPVAKTIAVLDRTLLQIKVRALSVPQVYTKTR